MSIEDSVFLNGCCVKGCEEKVFAMGLCNLHWRKNKRFGSPVVGKVSAASFRGKSPKERFDYQVRKTNSCWIWSGAANLRGYGSFKGEHEGVFHGAAHRFSYHYHKGVIPEGMMVCHTCDNPRCVNPEHLFLGTPTDNMQDMIEKGRNKPKRGEASHYAKLTEDQVLEIMQDTRPHPQIAAQYGVTKATVSSIKLGTSWSHVTGTRVKSIRVSPNKGKSDKFTEDDIRAIRASSEGTVALAKRYETTPSTICDIRKHRSWKHVH